MSCARTPSSGSWPSWPAGSGSTRASGATGATVRARWAGRASAVAAASSNAAGACGRRVSMRRSGARRARARECRVRTHARRAPGGPTRRRAASAVSCARSMVTTPARARSTQHAFLLAGAAAAAWLAVPVAAQQPWTVEMLEQNAAGFLTEGWLARIDQVAKLVATPAAWPAIQQVVHGDHNEYMVRIRTLLKGLTAERWLERERAERMLVEVG